MVESSGTVTIRSALITLRQAVFRGFDSQPRDQIEPISRLRGDASNPPQRLSREQATFRPGHWRGTLPLSIPSMVTELLGMSDWPATFQTVGYAALAICLVSCALIAAMRVVRYAYGTLDVRHRSRELRGKKPATSLPSAKERRPQARTAQDARARREASSRRDRRHEADAEPS